jgi:hypothetical protein
MPKLTIGTGNKRGAISRPNTSYTSPRAIKQRQRQATALDYRLQGHAYHAIAKHMNCDPSTVHDLVVKALANMVPREKAEAVLHLELTRLDAMEAAVFRNAAEGDIPSIDACLRIQHQRCRLTGLFPDQRHGGVHVNIGGSVSENAEDTGIELHFVLPNRVKRLAEEQDRAAKAAKVIEGFPVADLKPL